MIYDGKQPKILIVDDVPSNITTLAMSLQDEYQILAATNGMDALEAVSSLRPDAILLDVIMPDMDGYAVCEMLKANESTKYIPVVFVTSDTDPEHIVRGIELGAFYYITKPFDPELLLAIIRTALVNSYHPLTFQKLSAQSLDIFRCMEECHFRIRTIDEALHLSYILAEICPKKETSALGLMELIVNAVEHGSLGITYEEKRRLLRENRLDTELDRRQASPMYQDRHVTITMKRIDGQILFRITDQGEGFDWVPYLTFSPGRAFDLNGRGIAMAKSACFDFMEYHGKGNEVLAGFTTTNHC